VAYLARFRARGDGPGTALFRRVNLAKPGGRGEFSVNLSDGTGAFALEWLDVNHGKASKGEVVEGAGRRVFRTPFPGPAVLHLSSVRASR